MRESRVSRTVIGEFRPLANKERFLRNTPDLVTYFVVRDTNKLPLTILL